ncbi:MAG: hypothetical protein J0H09_03700 [Burkholderiales bacterium]|nr:hypothetical protein [Burkholderiales bacterium]
MALLNQAFTLERFDLQGFAHGWPVGSPLSAEQLLERRLVQFYLRQQLARQLRDLCVGLRLAQHRDDLFCRKSLLHRLLL